MLLFSESAGRVLVSVRPEVEDQLMAGCRDAGVPVSRVGSVTGAGDEAALEVVGQFRLTLADIRQAWEAPIPAAMGAGV